MVDLKRFLFVAPDEKIKDISERIRTVWAARSVTPRRVASLIGKITALYETIGDSVYLMTKSCQSLVDVSETWDGAMQLDLRSREELLFWVKKF